MVGGGGGGGGGAALNHLPLLFCKSVYIHIAPELLTFPGNFCRMFTTAVQNVLQFFYLGKISDLGLGKTNKHCLQNIFVFHPV